MQIHIIGDVSALLWDVAGVLPHPTEWFVPQIPRPISTAGFPLRGGVRSAAAARPPVRKRRRCNRNDSADCPVCLERLGRGVRVRLPCNHAMHPVCTFGLLTAPVLGAGGMMRCPLCRCPLDRYDLRGMGLDVGPARLRCIARRCDAVRALAAGADVGAVARLVRCAAGTRASDGFVYNTVLLAIERALFHRRGMVAALAERFGSAGPAAADEAVGVDAAIACHVRALIGTAHAVEDDPS